MRDDLIVLVPSRGRPEAANELADTFAETCQATTRLLLIVDKDDATLPAYQKIPLGREDKVTVCVVPNEAGTMVYALNAAARFVTNFAQAPKAIGFMGDDHRPRTLGWDVGYLQALKNPYIGMVYGDDLLQGERLPTQIAMRTELVSLIGFMAPPLLRHMYVDNFWKDLGTALSCIRYLPDVVIEHMHPVAGKAEWTEGHNRVNDAAIYNHDEAVYRDFQRTQMPALVERLMELRHDAPQKLGAFARQPSTRGAYPVESVGETPGEHEWRLFEEGTVPECTTAEWYLGREHAPHVDQPVHRDRLTATATLVVQAVFQSRLQTVVDLGSGDGGLLSLLGPRITKWGYDLMPANVEAAKKRGVDVRYGDVLTGDIEWGQVAVATEMLEHLVDPHGFLRMILQNSEALVCSSPWDERPGKAYEFHTWAWDIEGYRGMVEDAGWKVLRQRRVHRFQIILAVRP